VNWDKKIRLIQRLLYLFKDRPSGVSTHFYDSCPKGPAIIEKVLIKNKKNTFWLFFKGLKSFLSL